MRQFQIQAAPTKRISQSLVGQVDNLYHLRPSQSPYEPSCQLAHLKRSAHILSYLYMYLQNTCSTWNFSKYCFLSLL